MGLIQTILNMIWISRKKTNSFILFGVVLAGLLSASLFVCSIPVFAQNTLSLSVAPTLFDMSAVPGQEWQSAVRVINTNSFPLTVYINVVNFAPQGEGGTGKFLPVFENFTEGKTLAEWITVPETEVTIPAQQTQGIPFTVDVPDDASPGGHFAAILVGTKPPRTDGDRLQIRTAQFVTSLFFVRVAGDVVENGSIREFRVKDGFVSRPEIDFELRFENKGNVHLQPQGEISIYNMWGKERGVIPINHQTHFGNVLPDSVRKFNFNWKGEWSFAEVGKYSAVVTLGYGADGKKFVSSRTYFWVIPMKELSLIALGLISIILFVTWVIRLYVRKMLIMAGVDPNAVRTRGSGPKAYDPDEITVGKYETVAAPVKAGVRDFKDRLRGIQKTGELLSALASFMFIYKIFFLSIIVTIASVIAIVWYVGDARTEQRAYEVVIENPDSTITLSSEDVIYNELKHEPTPVPTSILEEDATTTIDIKIVNRSGIAGAAANQKVFLEKNGYNVGELASDLEGKTERTVIVYNAEFAEYALTLSQILDGVLLSARPADDADAPIVLFLGEDIESKLITESE